MKLVIYRTNRSKELITNSEKGSSQGSPKEWEPKEQRYGNF